MKLITLAKGPGGHAGAAIGSNALDFHAAAAIIPEAVSIPGEVREILATESAAYRQAAAVISTVLDAGPELRAKLVAVGALTPLAGASLLAPIPVPRLLVANGAAYHSHARDWDPNAPLKVPDHPPVGFIKGACAVTGSGSPIVIPKGAPNMIDYEGEFTLVFGRRCYQVSRTDAWDYIAGYTIINDVSARDWTSRINAGDKPTIAFSGLNTLYKNFPTFCPMGPFVTTKDELPGVTDFHLTTRLNGQIMQDSWTRDLIWSIPELVEHYSRIFAFEPGDLLSTGTPGGVGAGRKPPVFMKPGDVCSVTVDGLGTLENTVASGI